MNSYDEHTIKILFVYDDFFVLVVKKLTTVSIIFFYNCIFKICIQVLRFQNVKNNLKA